jgi:hypothetical protein
MSVVGRRIEIQWGKGVVVALEKLVDQPANTVAIRVFEISEDGLDERIVREVGPAKDQTIGHDVNQYMREPLFWLAEGESLTDEQMNALVRTTASPDLFGGEWSEELHERVYAPLIEAGLVVQTERPHPSDPDYELVHYEATEAGRELVRRSAT